MSVHELKQPVRVVKAADVPKPQMSDDVRRLCVSLITVLQREFPKDWRRVLEEMTAKAA